MEKIKIKALVAGEVNKVWDCYTNPSHITQWNFADPSWHCPTATNDMKVGGIYNARMEAKDGSFGFNFEAIYSEITPKKHFTYGFAEREVTVSFTPQNEQTEVVVIFDPEDQNPIGMQKNGWQAILNNFKNYVEAN